MTCLTKRINEPQVLAGLHEIHSLLLVLLMMNYFFYIAKSPSPVTYNAIDSIKKLIPKKAYTFGVAREAFKKVYLKHNPTLDIAGPGPGAYSTLNRLGKGASAFTMTAKAKQLSNNTSLLFIVGFVDFREKSPGPCAYTTKISINPGGKYIYSKYKNTIGIQFNPPTSKRFCSTKFCCYICL